MRTLTLLTLLPLGVTAQIAQTHYWDNWCLGGDVMLQFAGSGLPIADPNSQPLGYPEGNVVSDPVTGMVLFSTRGGILLDRNGQYMPRWGEISNAIVYAIVPHPGNPNIYYLFHNVDTIGLAYSTVDLSLNGGMGDLIGAAVVELPFEVSWGDFAGLSSTGGNKHWLVAHEASTANVLFFEVNAANGFQPQPIVQTIGPILTQSVISPGMRYAVSSDNGRFACSWVEYGLLDFNTVCLFNVDPVSGTLSDPLTFRYPIAGAGWLDIEFSPNGNVLYAGTLFDPVHQLLQFDLGSWDSLTVVNSAYSIEHPFYPDQETFQLRLGPDGRLYTISDQGAWFLFNLWRLNQPDSLGAACDPDTTGSYLGNQIPATFKFPWTFWPYMPNVGISDAAKPEGMMSAWMTGAGTAAVQLDPSAEAARLQVLAANGQVVADLPWAKGSSRSRIDMSVSSNAVYLARAVDASGRTVASVRFAKIE